MTRGYEVDDNLLIRDASQITTPWLARVLDQPGIGVRGVERIGTGQMSLTYRVTFAAQDGAEATVVVKLAADGEASRSTGVGLGIYRREVAFYQKLATKLAGPPRCHLAEYDAGEGWFTVVLEDFPEAVQGNQIAGCDVATARLVVDTLAALHAPVFDDPATATMDFLEQSISLNGQLLGAVLPILLERYEDRIDPAHVEVCRRYVGVVDALAADVRPPMGLVHGDFRLDNLLFAGDKDCIVVDWQTVLWGPAMIDLAYFLGTSLEVDDRRAHGRDLVRSYHGALVDTGVTNFDWEQCWEEYRRQSFCAVAMALIAPIAVERTERGDDMFMAVLRRACQQVIDVEAFDLVPEPSTSPEPLLPNAADEAPHEPAGEQLWSESWYFDAVGAQSDGSPVGVYVRLGSVPNLAGSVYSVAVVRPGRPTVMVTDYHCPHPVLGGDVQSVTATDYRAVQECVRPLQEIRVQFDGAAQQFSDDSDPLHAVPGGSVRLTLDLHWLTDGVPYQWRLTTRYEMPCHVRGTVLIDGEQITVDGPGQRDHSWGPRDWWSHDWMWTAFHLDDGTRVHAVTISAIPGFAVGYIQKDGQILEELAAGWSTATHADNGLVGAAHLSLGSEPLEIDVTPLGFGALRMESPDGRVSFFPRALATFRTAGGRTGTGWIEWNTNQVSAH